jgi:hypothetical protein
MMPLPHPRQPDDEYDFPIIRAEKPAYDFHGNLIYSMLNNQPPKPS